MAEEGNAGLAGESGPPGGSERRAAPRHPSSLTITCYPAGASLAERRRARVKNVSRTGIGLAVDRRWEPGTELVIELPGEDGVPRVLRARVVHATVQLGGLLLVGCTFDYSINDADLQALAR